MGNSRCDCESVHVLTFNNHLLSSVYEEVLYPFVGVACDTV